MDNEPEVIREEMAQTRASLADKIETLEEKVVGTVQGATSAVSDTVENVKDAVQETVASVKDTVSDTVEGVKEAFDLRRHVERHPCLMMGVALAVGYVGGSLLSRATSHVPQGRTRHRTLPPEGTDWPQDQRSAAASWMAEERRSAAAYAAPPAREHGWTSLFAPELAKFKGMAVGYLLSAVRDAISEALPRDVRSQVRETMDSITQKLGGQPVHGPVLQGASQRPVPGQGQTGTEERTTHGSSYTDVPGRW